MSLAEEFNNMSKYSSDEKDTSVPLQDNLFENINSCVNTILYGPPGTGKTYTALMKIDELKKSGRLGEVLIIQFHPQYTYQDFIEGYKFDGNNFKYTKGIFLDFCEKINNDKLNILYIDEINRADLSSVFGELLYLMDKDSNKKVLLPLSGNEFSLPENLIIIGSMNSSDKSISLIDFALRRRFNFIFVPPSLSGFNDILLTKEIDQNFDVIKYSRFFQVINSRILRHPLLGKNMTLGHSMFFSKSNVISNESVFRALNSTIIPQIESYFGAENHTEISQILTPEVAESIMHGKQVSPEKMQRLIDVVASSIEEVLF